MKTIIIFFFVLAQLANAENTNQAYVPAWTNTTYWTNLPSAEREIYNACKWGGATNGILMGVGLWGKNQFTVNTFLVATNSRGSAGPTPAPHGYRLDIWLKNSDGKLMRRTRDGEALCKPVSWYMRRTMSIEAVNGVYGLSNRPRKYDSPFDLLDSFDIQEPGTYVLFVKGALYWRKETSSEEAIPIDIPPASIQVSITQSALDQAKVLKENTP